MSLEKDERKDESPSIDVEDLKARGFNEVADGHWILHDERGVITDSVMTSARAREIAEYSRTKQNLKKRNSAQKLSDALIKSINDPDDVDSKIEARDALIREISSLVVSKRGNTSLRAIESLSPMLDLLLKAPSLKQPKQGDKCPLCRETVGFRHILRLTPETEAQLSGTLKRTLTTKQADH